MEKNKDDVKYSKKVIFLILYQFLILFLLIYFIIISWPDSDIKEGKKVYTTILKLEINFEQIMIWITFLMGGMGSLTHSIMSLSKRAGNKTLDISWLCWYLQKPFVGGLMGLMFYFVIRGGIMSSNSTADSINVYGICGIAGLAGLFSEQANKKLKEVFDTIFRVEEDKDKKNTEEK